MPVAESQLRVKTAASAVGWATTGGTRCTSWSRPEIAIFGAEIPFRTLLTTGKPQANTKTLIHRRTPSQRDTAVGRAATLLTLEFQTFEDVPVLSA